jgi:hypothetical protein
MEKFSLPHEFTSRDVSPWGGIKFFHGTYQSCGIREMLGKLPVPQPGSNRGYSSEDLIEGFLCSVVLGSRRLAHTGMLRTDSIIREIFGWKKGMADQSTFSRFFRKHSLELNDQIFPSLMSGFFEKIHFDKMTIDIDSTVITRFGEQENAEVGYNPTKRGRRSHHPIMAFCDELAMVLNAWMRSGDSTSLSDCDAFLNELFTIVKPSRIGLMRFDSGFYSHSIMHLLESQKEPVNYIIRAKITSRLSRAIQEEKDWFGSNEIIKGAQYAKIKYSGEKWDKERDFVIVRVPKSDYKEEPGLFPEINEYNRYEYKAFVTNVRFSAVLVHQLYNKRANAENRIKELKNDFGIEGFALSDFGAMEAAFRYVMVAYNVMAVFKQAVMQSKKGKMLSTIRFQCIAIGSYLVKKGSKKSMKLSAKGKQRHFLEHFFQNLEVLEPPFKFSNA